MGSRCLTEFRFHEVKGLETHFTAMWIYFTLLNYALKNGQDDNFYCVCVCLVTIKKKNNDPPKLRRQWQVIIKYDSVTIR